MSSGEEDEYSSPASSPEKETGPGPDDDTLRVMLSTDNHLGYMETDAVRGMDSFAAFEEVLYLAKKHEVSKIMS